MRLSAMDRISKATMGSTVDSALQEAGLDWEVGKSPLYYQAGGRAGNHYGMVRQDTLTTLGVCTDRYAPIQNRDAFAFLDNVVGGQASFHSGGTLNGGKNVFLNLKLERGSTLDNVDPHKHFLTLHTRHDGKGSMRAMLSTIRMYCHNQLSLISGNALAGISIRHSSNWSDKIAEVQEVFGMSDKLGLQFDTDMFRMMGTSLEGHTLTEYWDKSLNLENRKENDRRRVINRLNDHYVDSLSVVEHNRTVYAAYQAVTSYVDHNTDTKAGARSAMWGSGARHKQHAYQTALELC